MNAPSLDIRQDGRKTVLSLWRGEIIVRQPSQTMKAIASRVADAHGLTLADLRRPSRKRAIAWARQEAMAAMHSAGFSNRQAVRFFGLGDHTTCVHARQAVARRRAVAPQEAA